MKVFSSRLCIRWHVSVIVRGDRSEGEQTKRAVFLAPMLIAVLAPLAGVACADLGSDEAIGQAP